MGGEGDTMNNSPNKKSVFTFDPESKMEGTDDFTVLFERKMKEGDRSIHKRIGGLFKRKMNQSSGEESPQSDVSHYESDAETSQKSSDLRERDRLEESNDFAEMQAQITDANEEEQRQEDTSCESSSYDEPDPMTNTARDREMNEIPVHRHARSVSATSFTFSHVRKMSEVSFSTGYLYSFLAPTSGKLGIIIQSKGSSAPTIFQVKDYSPLFGQVEPGDKIMAVDGQDTSHMNTTEITNLLAEKRSITNDRTRRMKVTIMSRYPKAGIQPDVDESPLVPVQIDTKQIYDDVRDDSEVPETNDKKRQGTSYEMEYSDDEDNDDDDQSFHLIGNVNTDDYDDVEFTGVYMLGSGSDEDQFL